MVSIGNFSEEVMLLNMFKITLFAPLVSHSNYTQGKTSIDCSLFLVTMHLGKTLLGSAIIFREESGGQYKFSICAILYLV